MRKSQFIALVILLVVVAGLICVGAFRKDNDNTGKPGGTPSAGNDELFTTPGGPSEGTPDPDDPTTAPTATPGKVVFPTVDPNSLTGVSNEAMNWDYKVVSTENKVRTFTLSEKVQALIEGRKTIFTKERKEGQPTLYITFNGGYSLPYIDEILNVLKDKNVKATFFLSYDILSAEKNKDAILRMNQEGHLIGSRGILEDMTKLSAEKVAEQLLSLESMYQGLFGETERMLYFRPFGNISARNVEIANQLGYTVSFWSFSYYDYDDSVKASTALNTITSNFHDGEVMQLSISKVNAEVLKDMITEAERQGYVFKRLDQS